MSQYRRSVAASVLNMNQARPAGRAKKAPKHNGRPGDRCQELACAYPSESWGGLCGYHELLRAGKIPSSRPKLSEINVTIGRGWV